MTGQDETSSKMGQETTIEIKSIRADGTIREHIRILPDGTEEKIV